MSGPILFRNPTGSISEVDTTGSKLPVVATIVAGATTTDPGYSYFRSQTQNNVKIAVNASPGTLYGFAFINPNPNPAYVKVYDNVVANVTVGTTVPKLVRAIPAGDGSTPGELLLDPDGTAKYAFAVGTTIAIVGGLADANTAALTSNVHTEIYYK